MNKPIRGKDYIGVGVGAVIFNDKGLVFLSKRGKEVRNESGKWEFPGGGLDFMEDPKVAVVRREMKEEYDIEIEVIDLLGFDNHIVKDEGHHWVAPTYITKLISGEPKIMKPHKCGEIGWFTIEEVKNLELSIISQANLRDLLAKKEDLLIFIAY
ncbi:NUDIX domain-containing protein [Candidatus Dojkabacteria bacterium]|nr:NUDIX domain-containing protein [Candidatus Dojkabacteria bacterium]